MNDPYTLIDDWLYLLPLVALIYLGVDSRLYKRRYNNTPTSTIPQNPDTRHTGITI